MTSAIYCDFDGVLNDPERHSNEPSLAFAIPQITCPHKAMRLLKLALSTQSDLVLTSDLRKSGLSLAAIIKRSLAHSGIEQYSSFIRENRSLLRSINMFDCTEDLGNRSAEIRSHSAENGYSRFVVFEDSHPIDPDLNPIMIPAFKGLQDIHTQQAEELLNPSDPQPAAPG